MDYMCVSCGDLTSNIRAHVCFLADEIDEDVDSSLIVAENAEPDIWEKIIIEVEKRPVLWNFTLPLQLRSKDATTKAWSEIGGILNISLKDLQSKWRYLRDKYVKTKKDIEGYKPSGSASTPQKVWKYYNIMAFLKPYVQSRKTRSNMEMLQLHTVASPSPEPLTTPNSECSEVSAMGSSSKRRKLDIDPLSEQLLNVLKEPPPKYPVQDEVDGFCSRLAGSLRRLPRRKRAEVEIKMLQLLQEAEDSD